MGTQLLSNNFFNRPTLDVARELLGARLAVRDTTGRIGRHTITEVEAYDGPEDLASHASRGRTERNTPMFGPPGYWYVYLCYGMHWMLNIVTGPIDYPAAVLIRGLEDISGPARLTKRLDIDRRFDSLVANRRTGLWIETGRTMSNAEVKRLPRIGVDYAGDWADRPYRFIVSLELVKKMGKKTQKV
ncbi:3-methyladenine DNA glycosylase [Candidatus Uhrbacteria bacterium RIFOXYC2_FULL_47_19]|uniref:Putative 3-methyladenine DNA glycosylase n=1 Tax=Candidatus Uhrbacteria bacterium RIFOXYC2_FULL_47_19 TaxID=1802424 RepID=A0A1F7WFC1_9BACT|nr:MAG: 3-methyladenine DNA glycosylase [Candidatus Uhrbacteria bacterium RIFOXYC2_FULL_47_19]HCC22040.1 3-methyladenine DNA glycosylase [Candidatus Uhrbacteria bacterium]